MVAGLVALAASFGVASGQIFAHERADEWLSHWKEQGTKDQTDGRRVHLVAQMPLLGPSVTDSDLKSVRVNGQECLNVALGDDLTYFDWCRAHVNVIAKQLWVSYHTRNSAMHGNLDLQVQHIDGHSLVAGSVLTTAASGPALRYFTTRRNLSEAVLHLHADSEGGRVTKLLVDGLEVAVPAPKQALPASGHVVIVAPFDVAKSPGEVWTAVLFTDRNPEGVAYGGRVFQEHFPIVSWPHSEDCPLPGADDANWLSLKELGFNTVKYSTDDMLKNCNRDMEQILEGIVNSGDQIRVLPEFNTAMATQPAGVDAIGGIFIGDEVDGEIDAGHIRKKLEHSLTIQAKLPQLPTYQGSKTNHYVGAFAGMTDIQGADAYNAACAPTMVTTITRLTPDYPYQYLRNARNNHAPLPFWGYSQLYSDAWSYQPNDNEIGSQIAQMMLSGSKAMMFFQTHQKYFKEGTPKWASILRSIGTLREEFRVGDIEGVRASSSSSDVMVGTILTPEKLVLLLLNLKASGYSNTGCHVLSGRHWTYKKSSLEWLKLDLSSSPGVQALSNWKEVVGDTIGAAPIAISGSSVVTLSDIDLDSELVARFFVADVINKSQMVV